MELSDKMKRFAANRAAGLSQRDSAVAAGYLNNSANSLAVTAHRLDGDARIIRLTFELRERRLHGLACKALNTLEAVMDSPSAPPAAQVQAAKIVLSAAGHTLEAKLAAARHPVDGEKTLSGMSLSQLEALCEAAEMTLRQAKGQVIEADGNPQTDRADSEEEDE